MLKISLPFFFSGAAFFLAGCQQGNVALPAPNGSAISILSISPTADTVLKPGERVTLSVEVSYTLNADKGTVTLVVQSADNSTISNHVEVVTRGSGRVTLKDEFEVPKTGAIQVFTPLSVEGRNNTTTVDIRTFKVSPY